MDAEYLTKLFQFIVKVANILEIAFYVSVNPGYVEMLFALSDRQMILLFIFGGGLLYLVNYILDDFKMKNPGIYWSIRLMSEILGFPLLNYL